MTQARSQELFRTAAIAEDGMPVSAGARAIHIRNGQDAGKPRAKPKRYRKKPSRVGGAKAKDKRKSRHKKPA
jgi:uncharacterized protein (DUF849 family)